MRSILLAGAALILACPAAINAQTAGTPPADPTGSNTASANLPPATTPDNAGFPPPSSAPSSTDGAPDNRQVAPSGATVDNGTTASQRTDTTPKTYPVCSRTVRDECRARR